jgi:hypothetical protein
MACAAFELSFARFKRRRISLRRPVKRMRLRPRQVANALDRARNVAMGLPPDCPF